MKKWLFGATVGILMNTVAVAAPSGISRFFSELQTFSANFSQTVKQDGKIVQQSKGSVQLKKPLRFRWDYQTPEKMQLVSDGKRFYHYDIELAQVTVKPVQEVTGSALSTLLSDKEQLDDVFNVSAFGAPALKKRLPTLAKAWAKKAVIFYELTPKQQGNDDTQAQQIIVGLTEQRQLSVFYAKDAYGENSFVFSRIKQNQGIADKQFRFKAPKGVDVLQ